MMYQIFVRNYSEAGTFEAVKDDLDRIKALGTDIIYFLPIHPTGVVNRKGSMGSPYAIRDYRATDPDCGTIDEFKELVSAIHDKGMKCIMDIVYNHTSPDSLLAEKDPEWFYHKADGQMGNRVGEWTDVVDLDYSNDELWEYQIDTLKYWAEIVDGFRCDVAPLVPVEFWKRARQEVETVRPGCLWLAESVDRGFIRELRARQIPVASDGELYSVFDICYDYDIYSELADYLTGEGTLKTYLDSVNRQEWIYPYDYVKLRFIENHDRPRAHFMLPDLKALKNLTAFNFFQKGMAFVYAGEEFGAVHRPSLFDKDVISREPYEGIDLSDLIRRLAEIKKNEIFADSSYRVYEAAPDICVATHSTDDVTALGVFSLKGKSACINVPVPDGIYTEEISGGTVEVYEGCMAIGGEPVIILA